MVGPRGQGELDMSDDVQQPGPDEIARPGRISPEDDTEGHRFRGGATPTDEENLPGPDGGKNNRGVTEPDEPGPDAGVRPRI